MPIKKNKSQKWTSERRLSGVPPIMPIKTPEKKQKKGQNRTSEIHFTGVPPTMPIKTQKIYRFKKI